MESSTTSEEEKGEKEWKKFFLHGFLFVNIGVKI
jgi:hypothetical protein